MTPAGRPVAGHADVWAEMSRGLEELEAAGLRRRLRHVGGPGDAECLVDGARVLNFGSNNYLGLANHPAVVEAAAAAGAAFGAGAGASRLISGNQTPVLELETAVAALKRSESALVFSSGYLANLGALPVLAGEGDAIASDRLNHASLIDAARLSRARLLVYPHADAAALDALLARRRGEFRRVVIMTDGLFSMDGDLAPVPELLAVAERHDALLYLDEAHATGVLGPTGGGSLEHWAAPPTDRCVQMGTLSKALGSVGGFIAGPSVLRDALINRARAFMFDTGIPASAAAAASAALRIAAQEPWRRERLRSVSQRLRDALRSMGYEVPAGETPIIPVVLGENDAAMQAMEALLARGCLVPGVRPPTVPAGEARLRISLMATHTDEHLERLLSAFGDLPRPPGGARP